MLIETLMVGDLQTNCYIVGCPAQRVGIVIDPGGDPDRILASIRSLGLTILYVVNTHAHIDHTLADTQILEATGAKLAIHKVDAPALTDPQGSLAFFLGRRPPQVSPSWELSGGELLHFGSVTLKVLHTPGHTPGGITLLSDGIAFTGDTLFYRGVGRTDLPGGNWEILINTIREGLFSLPDSTIAYPGHGPLTTIGEEKRLNPFVRALE